MLFPTSELRVDDALRDSIKRFDLIASLGWTNSLRSGDTGLGFTFESHFGVEENNSQLADFKGIELKCKLKKKFSSSSKVNLFQLAPVWSSKIPLRDRLGQLGQLDGFGRVACYSQVTTTPNNLKLWLRSPDVTHAVDLLQLDTKIGEWRLDRLAQRLSEKHSRALFVSAEARKIGGHTQYKYTGLTYCERPELTNFLRLMNARRIVFEFAMHCVPNGAVRNHGYPWRLVDDRFLDQLFSTQVTLR